MTINKLLELKTMKEGIHMKSIPEFVNELSELSKKYQFSSYLELSIARHQMKLEVGGMHVNLSNVKDYETLPFDFVMRLKNDLTSLLYRTNEDSSRVYVTACVPEVISDYDSWDNEIFWYDYDLFVIELNEDVMNNPFLSITEEFDDKQSKPTKFALHIDDGRVSLKDYESSKKLYPFQHNAEIIGELSKFIPNHSFSYVSDSDSKESANSFVENVRNARLEILSKSHLFTNNQRLISQRITFNYLSNYAARTPFAGLVNNTYYIRPNYDTLNGLKYNLKSQDVPLYHNIVKDGYRRTSFGEEFDSQNRFDNLRQMSKCNALNISAFARVFDQFNVEFEKVTQLYVDVTNHYQISEVIYELGNYYFVANNDVVAVLTANFSDKDFDTLLEKLKSMIQSFIDSTTK